MQSWLLTSACVLAFGAPVAEAKRLIPDKPSVEVYVQALDALKQSVNPMPFAAGGNAGGAWQVGPTGHISSPPPVESRVANNAGQSPFGAASAPLAARSPRMAPPRIAEAAPLRPAPPAPRQIASAPPVPVPVIPAPPVSPAPQTAMPVQAPEPAPVALAETAPPPFAPAPAASAPVSLANTDPEPVKPASEERKPVPQPQPPIADAPPLQPQETASVAPPPEPLSQPPAPTADAPEPAPVEVPASPPAASLPPADVEPPAMHAEDKPAAIPESPFLAAPEDHASISPIAPTKPLREKPAARFEPDAAASPEPSEKSDSGMEFDALTPPHASVSSAEPEPAKEAKPHRRGGKPAKPAEVAEVTPEPTPEEKPVPLPPIAEKMPMPPAEPEKAEIAPPPAPIETPAHAPSEAEKTPPSAPAIAPEPEKSAEAAPPVPPVENNAPPAEKPAPAEASVPPADPAPAPQPDKVADASPPPVTPVPAAEPSPPVAETPAPVPSVAEAPAPAPVKEGLLPRLKEKFMGIIGKGEPAPPSAPPIEVAHDAPPVPPSVEPTTVADAKPSTPDIAPPPSADAPPAGKNDSTLASLPPLPPEKPDEAESKLPSLDAVTAKNDPNEALSLVQKQQTRDIAELPPLPSDAEMAHGQPTSLPELSKGDAPVPPPSKNPSALEPMEEQELASLPPLPNAGKPGPVHEDMSPAEPEKPVADAMPVSPATNTPEPQTKADVLNKKSGTPVVEVQFAQTETDVPITSQPNLRELARKLSVDKDSQVSVIAYASGPPEQASLARRVSLSRALAVRAFLIDLGVDNMRINVQAKGNAIPKDKGPSERVDVYIQ